MKEGGRVSIKLIRSEVGGWGFGGVGGLSAEGVNFLLILFHFELIRMTPSRLFAPNETPAL